MNSLIIIAKNNQKSLDILFVCNPEHCKGVISIKRADFGRFYIEEIREPAEIFLFFREELRELKILNSLFTSQALLLC